MVESKMMLRNRNVRSCFFPEPESRPNAMGTESRNKVFIKQSTGRSLGLQGKYSSSPSGCTGSSSAVSMQETGPASSLSASMHGDLKRARRSFMNSLKNKAIRTRFTVTSTKTPDTGRQALRP